MSCWIAARWPGQSRRLSPTPCFLNQEFQQGYRSATSHRCPCQIRNSNNVMKPESHLQPLRHGQATGVPDRIAVQIQHQQRGIPRRNQGFGQRFATNRRQAVAAQVQPLQFARVCAGVLKIAPPSHENQYKLRTAGRTWNSRDSAVAPASVIWLKNRYKPSTGVPVDSNASTSASMSASVTRLVNNSLEFPSSSTEAKADLLRRGNTRNHHHGTARRRYGCLPVNLRCSDSFKNFVTGFHSEFSTRNNVGITERVHEFPTDKSPKDNASNPPLLRRSLWCPERNPPVFAITMRMLSTVLTLVAILVTAGSLCSHEFSQRNPKFSRMSVVAQLPWNQSPELCHWTS
jgi:hypothetical protein